MRQSGVHGDLLVLLSQDRWIRIQGLVDELKGLWLCDPNFAESMTTSAATLLVYLSAALAINASKFGQTVLLLLLVVSVGLLAVCNHLVSSFQMNGFVLQTEGRPKEYRRRIDLANELIEESGRKNWAIRLGMIVANARAGYSSWTGRRGVRSDHVRAASVDKRLQVTRFFE